MLSLEVLAVVPLNDRVFQLTNPIGVAEDLKYTISDSALLPIVAVGQDRVLGRLRQQWWEPLDGINVYHALHVEQVDGYLNCVPVAYLINRLDVGPVD